MGVNRSSQQGASMLANLIVIMIAGIFFTVGFKLYGPYWEHWTIRKIVRNVSQDQDELKKSIPDIRYDLSTRFGINEVQLPSRDSLKIYYKDGLLHFDLKYERRVPMFYNVDAMVKFEDHFEAEKP